MYPHLQEWRRNREATVYLLASSGDGARVGHMVSTCKLVSAVTSRERKVLGALFAVGTWASNSFVIGKNHTAGV
jgi:hypothetical protein